ncbi:MAG: hypothetical protein EBY25_10860 [Betaproteobacteria bacterium]|nr:hypothetical protein [Betaproteobacteria bacterium]
MDDAAASKIVGKMEFTAAPAVMAGGKSATHVWWDGVVMPKNLGGDRDTVFQVLMEALDEETTAKGNDLTIWVRSSYKPTRFGTGVAASAKASSPDAAAVGAAAGSHLLPVGAQLRDADGGGHGDGKQSLRHEAGGDAARGDGT